MNKKQNTITILLFLLIIIGFGFHILQESKHKKHAENQAETIKIISEQNISLQDKVFDLRKAKKKDSLDLMTYEREVQLNKKAIARLTDKNNSLYEEKRHLEREVEIMKDSISKNNNIDTLDRYYRLWKENELKFKKKSLELEKIENERDTLIKHSNNLNLFIDSLKTKEIDYLSEISKLIFLRQQDSIKLKAQRDTINLLKHEYDTLIQVLNEVIVEVKEIRCYSDVEGKNQISKINKKKGWRSSIFEIRFNIKEEIDISKYSFGIKIYDSDNNEFLPINEGDETDLKFIQYFKENNYLEWQKIKFVNYTAKAGENYYLKIVLVQNQANYPLNNGAFQIVQSNSVLKIK